MTVQQLRFALLDFKDDAEVLFAKDDEPYGEGAPVTGVYTQFLKPETVNKNENLYLEYKQCIAPNVIIVCKGELSE